MKSTSIHQVISVLLLAALAGFSVDSAAKHSPGGYSYVNVPPVQWSPCFQDLGTFECAIMEVPLVHSRSSRHFYVNGGQPGIGIALIRIPASDQANKIGSLFLNPGGPGGSGVGIVLGAGSALYTEEVRARFDIVGFDPRGTNQSTPLRCFTSFDHLDALNELAIYPQTIEEVFAQIRFDRNFRKNCRKNAEPILDYMTTADVARDMDILRQAVGDKKLTYAGYSYGSYLGVTYANLFPHRVRALIVDAVLDPIAWATGRRGERSVPVSTRLRSDAGAQATLDEFFRLCDLAGAPRCVFAGNSAGRYATLVEKLKANPVILPQPGGEDLVIDDVFLIANTLFPVLYNSFLWEGFANDLLFLELQAGTTASASDFNVLGKAFGHRDKPNLVDQTIEAFPGVLCSDSDNPNNPFAWAVAAENAQLQHGNFGRIWTWASSPCAKWPASKASRYAGPFDRRTANPVLVTSNLFDPATRYEGALTVAELLPNSHLLTVEGWGHVTLFLSQCATQIASDYLVDGVLPGAESTCRQDFPPFGLAPDEVFADAPAVAAQGLGIQGPDSESAASLREQAEQERARIIRAVTGGRPTYGER